MKNKGKGLSYRDVMDMVGRSTPDMYRQQVLKQRISNTSVNGNDVSLIKEKDSAKDFDAENQPAEIAPVLINSNSTNTPAATDNIAPDLNKSSDDAIPFIPPVKALEEVFSRYLS